MSKMCQIKASAGSGKTYALTERYLKLMSSTAEKEASPPRHVACKKRAVAHNYRMSDILAITFTNAAVTEIRKRVIENLKKISLGKMEMKGLDKDSALLCLEELLDNMDEMNVRTIDSLLHQIVRSAALSIGLNPDFEPVFKSSEAIQPYLDKYMEEAFLGDAEKREVIKSAVENYLEHDRREDKPCPLILSKGLAQELGALLNDILIRRHTVTYAQSGEQKGLLDRPPYEMKTPLPYSGHKEVKEAFDKYQKVLREKGMELKALADAHKAGANNKEIKWNKDFTNFLQELGKGSSTINFDVLSKTFTYHINKKVKQNFDQAAFENIYNEMAKYYKAYCACREHLKYVSILSLGEAIVEEYSKDSRQAKALPSILIPVLAEKALSLDDGVCDALCRLGTRLTHFLLDEFQDTSVEQWSGIYSLVREALSTNGSLTWVGDIKQSIFMWRDASPELFDRIKDDTELTCMVSEVECNPLEYNWRSAANIVKFNNELFETLNTDAIGKILNSINSSLGKNAQIIEKIRQAFGDCSQKLPPEADSGGLVRVQVIDEDGFWDNFCQELLAFIKTRVEEKGEIALSDIMILVRENDNASVLARSLAEANIPVITENSLLLNGEELVREAVALLEFIVDPSNDRALLTVLCGKAFLSHPELEGLDSNDFYSLAFEKRNKSLYKSFKEKYPLIWQELLEPYYKDSSFLPPYDVIREWFRTMALEARFPEKKIFLSAFLEYLHRAELAGYNSISAFLEHWHKEGVGSKAIMPDGVDAVQIRTIHKAKGLQAPVVFVPVQSGSLKNKANQSGKRIQHQLDDLSLNVRLLKIFENDYENIMMREAQEILNMMYVAFTRAEKELHIYASSKKANNKDSRNLLETMMECAKMAIPYSLGKPWIDGKKKNGAQEREGETGMEEILQAENELVSFPWISKLKVAQNTLFTAQDSAKRRGTFLHFCLENMRFTGNSEDDAQTAYNLGLSHSGISLSEEELIGIQDALLWFRSQKGVRDWLERGWKEQPMLDADGNELRMDLVVPEDWGALVIDYKSGQMTEENREQMQAYLRCLRESGEFGDRICGLLVYLDKKKFLPVGLDGFGEESETCPDLPFNP